MADDSVTRAQILKLAKNRARNSVIAFRHKDNPAILEGRIRADHVWRDQQQELASQLPKDDTLRETVEFIGELDAKSPPPHLIPRNPKR